MRRDPEEIHGVIETIYDGADQPEWEDIPMGQNQPEVSNEAAVAAALRDLLDSRHVHLNLLSIPTTDIPR